MKNKLKRKLVEQIRKNDLLFRLALRVASKHYSSNPVVVKARRVGPSSDRMLLSKAPVIVENIKEVGAAKRVSQNASAVLLNEQNGLELDRALFNRAFVLYRLRNYLSASRLFRKISISSLTEREQLVVAQCFLSSIYGVDADKIIEDIFFSIEAREVVDVSLILNLAEKICTSGFSYEYKVNLLNALKLKVESGGGFEAHHLIQLNWFTFKLMSDVEIAIDPLEYVDLNDSRIFQSPVTVKFLTVLRSYGYDHLITDYLEARYAESGFSYLGLFKAYIICWPEWFVGKLEIIESLPDKFLGDLALLSLLHSQKSVCAELAVSFERCFERQRREYGKGDVYKKNAILRTFVGLGLIDEVLELSKYDSLPDTIWPTYVARGYRYFENDDFHSARDCFLKVLEEDPADEQAAAGLRLVLPRTGKSVRAVLGIRDKIGYGVKSSGRKGVRYLGSELTSSLLMSGEYLKGQYTIRNSKNWLALKRFYNDKFLNCELLSNSGAECKSIFIIGDSGVGDEIRAAQFYGEIAKVFANVTVSCDPRLYNIFSASFPSINFISVPRYRKGVSSRRVGNGEKRIIGFDEKVSNYLTEDCRGAMESAAYITYSQNLYFNHFAGALKRPEQGGYLKVIDKIAIPKSKPLRVGILWRSHFRAGSRKYMYLDLEDFLPLTELDNLELWSIQHCIDDDEINLCHEHGIKLIEDIDLFNDFEGLSNYLANMDLLIGISSVPIELGAALGTEVWMLGFSPENYFLRSSGGKDMHDRYTMNSSVIAPPWIDFSEPRDVCVKKVFDEVRNKLKDRILTESVSWLPS